MLIRLWWGYIIMLFDLFIFLSWPSMWWTGPFTPTQQVSLQLEWYMYTLSYISTHRQTCKVQWGSSSHANYLPSSYFLSLVYSEHDNTQLVCNKQWYVQSWTFYWCCDDVDVDQTVMRLHNHVVWLVYLTFLTYVVNWSIHSYSASKFTIRMVHVHFVLH